MELVEAVKTQGEIKQIANLLEKHKGTIYKDIWVLGVNAALRISDLLSVTMEMALKGTITINEGKTGKLRVIPLNNTAMATVRARAEANPTHIYLFEGESNRAKFKPISRSSVTKSFKEIGDILGLKLGTHSMRKTLGYVMYSQGERLERISKVLNHKDTGVTMRYIGLTQEDVNKAYEEYEITF